MSKNNKTTHHQINRDESFAELIQGVVPYKKLVNQIQIKKIRQSKVKRRFPNDEAVGWDDYLPAAELLDYKKPGVQERVTRRLKRGTYPINRELDLHGLRLSEARVCLSHFLNTAQEQKAICVLIIHGKGLNSRSAKSVLRPNVRNWLSQDERVLAFTQAPKSLGADGATYVLLRGARTP